MEFKEFPKVPRLSREMVITEKLDGTNASVMVTTSQAYTELGYPTGFAEAMSVAKVGDAHLFAGSRTRWLGLSKSQDNYGFAKWVADNAQELVKLGEGHHFGEWWGKGIQRGYGLTEKRFSLFNTHRWGDPAVRPSCCHVVPTLYQGQFNTLVAHIILRDLELTGSKAAPGFMNPEGIMVYHTAGNNLFKKTIKDDDVPKTLQKADTVSGGN